MERRLPNMLADSEWRVTTSWTDEEREAGVSVDRTVPLVRRRPSPPS
jgi:hypothetical protein